MTDTERPDELATPGETPAAATPAPAVPEVEPAPETEPAPAKRPGRGVAYLALLLALAAGAGAGYQHWRAIARDAHMDSLTAELAYAREALRRLDAVAADAEQLRTEVDRVRGEQARQDQALAQARDAVAKVVAAPRTGQAPRPAAWRLAEVEHLLRGANTHMLLARDAAAARRLLASADAILAELDDFALHDVRALLAEDLAALAAYRGADVTGVFLRLEALRGLLDDLPLRLPAFTDSRPADESERQAAPTSADPEAEDEASVLQAVWTRLAGLVRFRRHEVRPLLPPQEAAYLEQRLRLTVDRAQLAALRRDQAIFDAVLTTADDWLRIHLAPDHAAVQRVRAEIAALRQVELAVPPPDISRPLARLRAFRPNTQPATPGVAVPDVPAPVPE